MRRSPQATGEDAMPTFVMLSTLTPEGVQTLKNNPQRIREVNKEIEQLGATVKAQWAVLGQYDFVNVVEPEAPLVAGVVDALSEAGLRAFGPRMAPARIEGSKAYAKELMRELGVP